jgi:DNA modification methylase
MIEGNGYALLPGNCLEALKEYPDGSFASVVCDPPQKLDTIPAPVVWAEIFRVAAPGAFLLAFGNSRTFHRLACAIEDGGWIYFDTLGQIVDGSKAPSHHHLRQGWRPLVLACKGVEVLRGHQATLGDFTLGELIQQVTPPEGCVLDPFMGLGVVGLVALAAGFTFVGVEKDPDRFTYAAKRLEAADLTDGG